MEKNKKLTKNHLHEDSKLITNSIDLSTINDMFMELYKIQKINNLSELNNYKISSTLQTAIELQLQMYSSVIVLIDAATNEVIHYKPINWFKYVLTDANEEFYDFKTLKQFVAENRQYIDTEVKVFCNNNLIDTGITSDFFDLNN